MSTNDQIELKPCPFCGGPSHISENPEDWGYYPACYCVSCNDMDCRGYKTADGGDPESKEEAVRKWNRRRAMNLLQRILITALAFCVGIALLPLTPVLMAWLFWGETDEREDARCS